MLLFQNQTHPSPKQAGSSSKRYENIPNSASNPYWRSGQDP